jgi:mono/diheme cytochrome c family protein
MIEGRSVYDIVLFLHNSNRWLVVLLLVVAVGHAWWKMIRQSDWTEQDKLPGAGLRVFANLQFVLGIIVYLLPQGIARGAWRDLGAAMEIDELRFFGFEHPFAMIVAVALINIGWHRAKDTDSRRAKRRWSAGAYTIAMILVVGVVPWWRPLLRDFNPGNEHNVAAVAFEDLSGEGSADRGEELFRESFDGLPSCETCHTINASRRVGPGLGNIGGVAGDRVGGESAEQYLLSSIVAPGTFVVDGYSNMMPSSFGDSLSDEQLLDLIAYLLTLKE